jgi:pimeloyl-ACP methyl ester carboxylesterase
MSKALELLIPEATGQVRLFHISVPQETVDDLRARLRATRFPNEQPVEDWSQGVPLADARALVQYWESRYDWRRFETELNSFPNFRTLIDGLGIHFIHARSPHPDALPILLTHGWPGSIAEFIKIIRPLTNPTEHGGRGHDAFHVVIPSLPGSGCSDKPTVGWKLSRIASAWSELMQRLGYSRWVAQGGDWGAGVTTALGHLLAPGLVGIHLNWQFVFPPEIPEPLSFEEQRAIDGAKRFLGAGNGYFRQQATRTQTIGYALSDSPAGQAMWIYEKFYSWTDNKGSPEDALSLDQMLDNISLYWFTNTAASSARIYWENKGGSFPGGKLSLPVAATVFPREIYRAPKSWAEQTYSNLIYWNEAKQGGHFAAFEEPDIFVEEMRSAFRKLR